MERPINSLGYHFLRKKNLEQAVGLFKLNMELFPNSFNVYDSYGECLLQIEKPAEAKVFYQKALNLNPGNQRISRILEQLD